MNYNQLIANKELNMNVKQAIIEVCVRKAEFADQSMVKFVAKLNESPIYALSWADTFLKVTTEKQLYSGLKTLLETTSLTMADLEKEYMERLIRLSGSGVSSSDMSNVMTKVELAVTGEILQMVSSFKD
jgi:hypothetical protein